MEFTPDINFRAVLIRAHNKFRCSIIPADNIGSVHKILHVKYFRTSKVTDPYIAILEKHILRLQVTMNNILFVHELKPS